MTPSLPTENEELPTVVQNFLQTCIDSVEQLSVLLLLYSDPNKVWSVSGITAELRSTDTSIAKRLDDLYARNVLKREGRDPDEHRFSPPSERQREVIRQLAEQNQLRPYRVIDAIYSQPEKTLKDFADAFKLRGDKE